MAELQSFYAIPSQELRTTLIEAICRAHTYHFERNAAYRRTVSGRGVGPRICQADFAGLLRPAALTFKEYIERIGPFPQDHPLEFLSWLQDQLSISLPVIRSGRLRRHYPSLEVLLRAIEEIYQDMGVEVVTSSGTSGLASFVVRDRPTVELAVNSFFTAIQRNWNIQRGLALIFMMPRQTRVAMARVAHLGTSALGWGDDSPVYYTIPFGATPDQIRIRSGRLNRPGIEGWFEKRVLNPFMEKAYGHLATPRILKLTQARLQECIRASRPLLLLGGMSQLHLLALEFLQSGPVQLPPGSRVATGGGMKERYPYTPSQIRSDLLKAFPGTPVQDVYGMAEANWAAFECPAGNYHLPPWVYAVVMDEDDRILDGSETTGRLAFYDPCGGGCLVPPFFLTADQVHLVNGSTTEGLSRPCPCGETGAYIAGRIQRIDLIEEAGCAGQV